MLRLRFFFGCALIAVASLVGCKSSGSQHDHGHHDHAGHSHDISGPTLAPPASGYHEGSGGR